jgi:hypothetical protein
LVPWDETKSGTISGVVVKLRRQTTHDERRSSVDSTSKGAGERLHSSAPRDVFGRRYRRHVRPQARGRRRRRFERERAEHASCEKRVRRGIVRHVRDAEICSRRVETSPEDASG